MLPCLTIWANAMGILGGSLFGVAQADFTFGRYIQASIDSLLLRDITTGLVKSVMFGITITAVGCLEGLSTGAGAEQVGRSTTQAVVKSIFLVVVVDLFFTVLFFSQVTNDDRTNTSGFPYRTRAFTAEPARELRRTRDSARHQLRRRARRNLVILGGSGSGKSTLLRTLVGLEKPSR